MPETMLTKTCLGFATACPHHAVCPKYAAVETEPYAERCTTCRTPDGRYPVGEAAAVTHAPTVRQIGAGGNPNLWDAS